MRADFALWRFSPDQKHGRSGCSLARKVLTVLRADGRGRCVSTSICVVFYITEFNPFY
jgi:hypothetical protein